MFGIQQLIQSLPRSIPYVPLASTTKKVVGKLLLPTISSTHTTALVIEMLPLECVNLISVGHKSSAFLPRFLNVEYTTRFFNFSW